VSIAPKPMNYGGILFRSTLEAKWAMLFDFIGIQFRYEPKRFKTEAGYYLPDFWLPEMDLWLELKPSTDLGPSFDETRKAQSVADQERRPCIIVCGFPTSEEGSNKAIIFLPGVLSVDFYIQNLLWSISFGDRLMYSAAALSAESRARRKATKSVGEIVQIMLAEDGVIDRYAHNDGAQDHPREERISRSRHFDTLRNLIIDSSNEIFGSFDCLNRGAA
jgi:hypothetical protein